jgi:hypothetical protein
MGESHLLFAFPYGFRLVLAARAPAVYQTAEQA